MREIFLSRVRGKFKNFYALVDDDDYDFLNQFNWSYRRGYVAMRCRDSGKWVTMHRYMACLIDSKVWVDHKDGNGLNNQKENLRPCTPSQNQINKRPRGTSKYLGVNKLHGKWRAAIVVKGRQRHLGLFNNEIDAAKAYDAEAKIHHGEFARLNFINA